MSGSTETCITSFVSNFGPPSILQSIRFSALCTRPEKNNTRKDVCIISFTQLTQALGCPLPFETLPRSWETNVKRMIRSGHAFISWAKKQRNIYSNFQVGSKGFLGLSLCRSAQGRWTVNQISSSELQVSESRKLVSLKMHSSLSASRNVMRSSCCFSSSHFWFTNSLTARNEDFAGSTLQLHKRIPQQNIQNCSDISLVIGEKNPAWSHESLESETPKSMCDAILLAWV